ncbi:MAG: MYG1 family protein [Verrucomicrobiales bacterium]|nr:MYG1 family protein [Verrucomicrobiales bacterium]
MPIEKILTHPGSSHKDELLACCVLLYQHQVPLVRREPSEEDLRNPNICVVDVGGEHDPQLNNFDHHQFPRDSTPQCALSLVLQDLDLYEKARAFCDWLEPAEWLDTRGPVGAAKWMNIDRKVLGQLISPIDITLLRRFAQVSELNQKDVLWQVMRMVGEDIIEYIKMLSDRLLYLEEHCQWWTIGNGDQSFEAIFLPRTDPLPQNPSMALPRFINEQGKDHSTLAMIYPDSRGDGYGLSRHNDNLKMDFTAIENQSDVHFAHKGGFVAKSTATDPQRLKELLALAYDNS